MIVAWFTPTTAQVLSICVAVLGLSRVATAQSTLAPTSSPACDCDTNGTVLQEVILCAANAFDASRCGIDGNVSMKLSGRANVRACPNVQHGTAHSHRLKQEPLATTYRNSLLASVITDCLHHHEYVMAD